MCPSLLTYTRIHTHTHTHKHSLDRCPEALPPDLSNPRPSPSGSLLHRRGMATETGLVSSLPRVKLSHAFMNCNVAYTIACHTSYFCYFPFFRKQNSRGEGCISTLSNPFRRFRLAGHPIGYPRGTDTTPLLSLSPHDG